MIAALPIQAYTNTRLISPLELSLVLLKSPQYIAQRKLTSRNFLTEMDFAEFDAALFERGHLIVNTKSLTPGANSTNRAKGATRWIAVFSDHDRIKGNDKLSDLFRRFEPRTRIEVREVLAGVTRSDYRRGKQWLIDDFSWLLGHGKPPVRPCVYPTFNELAVCPPLWQTKGWTSFREDRPRDINGYFN